jgi:hypothetical protein
MREATPARDSIRQALGGELADHPTYEMIEQVVDGTADDVTREIVDSHRGVCPRCDAEIRDLQSFAGRSSSSALLRWLGATAAVIAVIFAGAYLTRRRPVERAEKPAVREPATRVIAVSGYGRDDWNAEVRGALERGAIERPAIVSELRLTADVLRGPGQESTTAIMSPVGVVIDSTTPMLTWRAAPGRYVVSVYDGVERVARSAALRSPEWRVVPPLARGRTYAWQVEIHRGASVELLSPPPARPAFVHVLDESSSATLAEARRRFPGDHLLLGVLHARFGMQQTAAEELRVYAAQHPEARNAAALADSVERW